jgi:non-ribosomal peptide synthetase component E (peptide arylation enzyme)
MAGDEILMNLHDLFAIPLRRTPQKTALQWPDDDGSEGWLTYQELLTAADELAAGLQEWGLEQGRSSGLLSQQPG